MFDQATIEMIIKGFGETLYMTVFATLIAYIIGLPLGIILAITDEKGICPKKALNTVLGFVVNILRSVPFLILMVALIPFTRLVVGTTIGPTAAAVPLIIASAPFIARLVEGSIMEVDAGVVEAAQSMGASTWQIITKVLVPEAKSPLIVGGAIAIATILGYSAMAGFCGGGGLGDIATRYGYHRQETDIMLVCIIVLVIIVQLFQEIGYRVAKKTDKKVNS